VDPSFEAIFRTSDGRQDNFRSRLFGLFSEEIVRVWAADTRAPYEDVGRPTLFAPGDIRGSTLDFMLRRRGDNRQFVAELKAEFAFEKYAYLRLSDPGQLRHHQGVPAFARLLEMTRSPGAYEVRVGGKRVVADGAVLVWGAVSEPGRQAVVETFGFTDVLSLEEILVDLRAWSSPAWRKRLGQFRSWSNGLFDALL
jgi:hypothetical protein